MTWLEWLTVTQEFWVRILADPKDFPLGITSSLKGVKPGRVAQSVTYLAIDACLTAYTGVASSIPGPVPFFDGN